MDSIGTLLSIRAACRRDVPALAGLLAELGFPAPVTTIMDRLDTMLATNEVVLVATRGAEPLGLVTVHVTPVLHRPTPVGRLTALIVTEKERGQGIGRALVTAAEEALAAKDCALVEVTSNSKLTDAHGFYKRLGYEVTSLRFKKDLHPRFNAQG
jgi:predicted N-acetyltransferase YhbS